MLKHTIQSKCENDKTFNDTWLIEKFKNKTNGYYIELGAGNGLEGSCTYILEKYYHWKGISLEANFNLYKEFISHRKNPCINKAICGNDGEEDFIIPNRTGYAGLTRTITEYHKKICYGEQYVIKKVKTISFLTLLKQCPNTIDFISMDIEGAELDCLSVFPFDNYKVQCFIVELSNDKIIELLIQKKYKLITNPLNTEATWEKYFWATTT